MEKKERLSPLEVLSSSVLRLLMGCLVLELQALTQGQVPVHLLLKEEGLLQVKEAGKDQLALT
jgi:hypothetical protein